MNKLTTSLLAATTLALAAGAALAQDKSGKANPDDDQVVVPKVERRDIKLPRFPSRDFEVGAFVGTYATQNFGASAVGGLRVGYHITEDFFVLGAFGTTKVSDEAFRQILPGGVLNADQSKLSYYNVSVGYNVMPGEVFFGRNVAKASAFYVIGGVGTTRFNLQRQQTINIGAGMKLYLGDRISLQLDARDHMFSLDLLGKRQSTHNLEFSGGASFYF
jgi:outer membrane beta-barrel protein